MEYIIECTEAGLDELMVFIRGREDDTFTVSVSDDLLPMYMKLYTPKSHKIGKFIKMAQYTFVLDGLRNFPITKAKLIGLDRDKVLKYTNNKPNAILYIEDAVKRLRPVIQNHVDSKTPVNTDHYLELSSKNITPCQINWLLEQILGMHPSRKYFLLDFIIRTLNEWGLVCLETEFFIRGKYLNLGVTQ